MTITDKSIQAYIRQAQKNTSTKYTSYTIGNNLSLRVHTKTGNAAWLYRIALPDKSAKYGYKFSNKTIGPYPTLSLLEARLKAAELLKQVKSGINPVAIQKQQQAELITLKEIWDKWMEAAPIKPVTKLKLGGMYKHHISKIANQPILNISDKVTWDTVIQPILNNGNKTQARIVLSKLKQLSRFAYETHLIDKNPFDRLVIPNEYKVKKVRERTLGLEELKRFLLALDTVLEQNLIDIRYHHYIKLVLLLGTRKTELATLKWDNYNIVNGTILLTETKTGDALLIKLPIQAIELLNDLYQKRINDYIFYGTKENQHFSIRSILYYLERVTSFAKIEDLTIHDLRRTFSSRLSGLKFRLELIEKATNHRVQGTARHYQHDDMLEERYEMLQTWANYLDRMIKNEKK